MKVLKKIETVRQLLNEIDKSFRSKVESITVPETSKIIERPKALLYQYLKNERNISHEALLEYSEILFRRDQMKTKKILATGNLEIRKEAAETKILSQGIGEQELASFSKDEEGEFENYMKELAGILDKGFTSYIDPQDWDTRHNFWEDVREHFKDIELPHFESDIASECLIDGSIEDSQGNFWNNQYETFDAFEKRLRKMKLGQ